MFVFEEKLVKSYTLKLTIWKKQINGAKHLSLMLPASL